MKYECEDCEELFVEADGVWCEEDTVFLCNECADALGGVGY